MYYKVIKDNKIIDVLDNLVYLKYQKKHNRMVLCKKSEAQAFFSSDRKNIWRMDCFPPIPVEGYDTVEAIPINKYEYDQLKILDLKTPEEIIDAFVTSLLEDNLL